MQGRKHTEVSGNACIQIGHQTPITYSNPAISAEQGAEVPFSPAVSLAGSSSCCGLLGQLSVKVDWGWGWGASLYGSLPISLFRGLRAVSVSGESANFLPAQEGMYINIIKCLISEAAVFC